tara:strand:- start:351 stop:1457 length:1107 start_codon:yes stop_codon:yes gene_type:complete
MKLLMNDKEIANFLLSLVPVPEELFKFNIQDRYCATYIQDHLSKKAKWKEPNRKLEPDEKKKFKDKLLKAVRKDLDEWVEVVNKNKGGIRDNYFHAIHNNIEYFIDAFGIDEIFAKYKVAEYKNFVKGTGAHLGAGLDNEFIRRKEFTSFTDDCLIRNTVGNEDLLVSKIDNNYPFWFIDSGYTNFLESNKKWHRLVRSHLHYGKSFDAPADRLGNFKKFPRPWRKDGEIIYVIEPGPFAASIMHVDLKTWKYDVAKELRKYTDKRIRFRSKAPKKKRTDLHKELLNDDYYCLVNINSNAATEAIWAGVPAITLDTHITNPVTRNKLSDINNLYRDNIGSWLCMLSYSQFTKEELLNGKAASVVKRLP